VTVGEALAEARAVAGLTVDEVSERTKIREVVIRGIERDEYDACGGDLFVRGYVRVIADAVGIDAQPLIHEYDKSHKRDSAPAADPGAQAGPASETGPAPAPESQAEADPVNAEPAPAPDPTPAPDPMPAPDPTPAPEPTPEPLPAQSATPVDEPAPTVTDLPQAATPGEEPPADHLAADAGSQLGYEAMPQPGYELVPLRIQPGPRLHPSLTRRTWRRWLRDRRRSVAAAVSVVVVLAVAAIAGTLVDSSAGSTGAGVGMGAAASPNATHQAPPPRGAAAGADSVGASARKSAAKAAPHAKRTAPARRVPVRQLAVSFAEAFGPDGPGDGDNPDNAMNAVRPGAAQPWNTQWYKSARFGALKSGTGLLLDMGSTVTITSVTVRLGPRPGAELELRVAQQPDPAAFRTSGTVTAASATATLTPAAPVQARYVLLWCTRLPPSGTGTYQLFVHRVTVEGRP
jgi:hypothetical protein